MSMVSRRFRTLVLGAVAAMVLTALCSCPGPGEPTPGETRTFDGMEFQWCPAGSFAMGSPGMEAGAYPDETLHEVTLSMGFWLGKCEVTQARWEAVMGVNPSYYPGAERPVESVSWEDIQDYLLILNATTSGGTYRLPTEAEWEYACRAGTTTRYYWGNDDALTDIDAYAWYAANSNNESHPVGEKLPNGWGLYDMTGNVDELCQDWYGQYPEGPVTDPQGPDVGETRVARGGDWGIGARGCRCAWRDSQENPNVGYEAVGFRLLRTQD